MKLYHYVHCPFCLRVRMTLGYLNIPYDSIVLPYDDEVTPVKLTGKKILPAFEFASNDIINESLDIAKRLDTNNKLKFELISQHQSKIDELLNRIGSDVHSLCMPYWIYTQEFNESSRKYFQEKKEVKRGPFKNLIQNKDKYIAGLNITLSELKKDLSPYYLSSNITILDIMIASHLWGMFIFPEFQFSEKMYTYLMKVKSECHFDYHQDYFR